MNIISKIFKKLLDGIGLFILLCCFIICLIPIILIVACAAIFEKCDRIEPEYKNKWLFNSNLLYYNNKGATYENCHWKI